MMKNPSTAKKTDLVVKAPRPRRSRISKARNDDGTIFVAGESLPAHTPYKRRGTMRKVIKWSCGIAIAFVLASILWAIACALMEAM